MSTFRDKLFEGKSLLISGASSGINLVIAKRFARAGCRVAVVARDPEKLKRAVEEIGGPKTEMYSADVRDFDALEKAAGAAREAIGTFDFVLAGAAGNFPAPAAKMSANAFKAVIDIDLLGTYNLFRAAYPHLNAPGASLLAISATHAWQPIPFQSHVCAAKSGIEMLIKTLAIEWGGKGIRLNAIEPGPIDKTEGMDRLTPTPESRAILEKRIPLGRYGEKDEIADAAFFLCSDAARYVTGAVLTCDGGQSLLGSGSFADVMESLKA